MLRLRLPASRTVCLALLICLVTAAGCTSVTARLAGWYVTRKIDSYLDLDRDQKSWLREGIDRELDTARRVDLPRWLHLFRMVRDTMDEGATDAKLARLQNRYDLLMDDAIDKLAPKMALLFSKLSDEQIDHFERRMMETLEETYEEQQLNDADRRERMDERILEGVESLAGELREEQAKTILAAVHALPDERPVQYKVGRQRIAAGGDFLRKHPGAEAIEAEIHRLWDTRYEVLGPGRGKQARRAEQRKLLLTIDGTMSREQRDHAVAELNDRIRQARRFQLPAK